MLEKESDDNSSDLKVYTPRSEDALSASEYLKILNSKDKNITSKSHFAQLEFALIDNGGSTTVQSHVSCEPAGDIQLSVDVWTTINGNDYLAFSRTKQNAGTSLAVGGQIFSATGVCTWGSAHGIVEWGGFFWQSVKNESFLCA